MDEEKDHPGNANSSKNKQNETSVERHRLFFAMDLQSGVPSKQKARATTTTRIALNSARLTERRQMRPNIGRGAFN